MRDRIDISVRKREVRYLTRNWKFAIELPTAVEKTLTLDGKNGNTI